VPRNEIIIGLDDSPSGLAALRWAAQHALQAGSRLRAIHVLDWPYSFSSATPGVDGTPLTMDEIETAYQTNITNVFDKIDPRPGWSLRFLRGDPGPVLVRESKGAQLLVIGLESMWGSVDYS
jgi:nucleotide-binding universal stress UspA family protein